MGLTMGVASGNPTGSIIMFTNTTNTPPGYLFCNGVAVSRTTYAALFNVIGTQFGAGDGSTTFNLPNMLGKMPVGIWNADPDFATMGNSSGEKTHTLVTNEIPSHDHQTTANGGYYAFGGNGGNPAQGSGYGTQLSTLRTGPTGGGAAHNNMPPYLVLLFLIKT